MLIFPTGQGKSGLQCSVKSLMTLNSEQRELATSQAPPFPKLRRPATTPTQEWLVGQVAGVLSRRWLSFS